MSTIGDKVRHELRELVPATVYLVVTFNIIGFTKYLLLRDYGINVSTFASSTILALLAAKAMVVADTLPFMEPFRPRPITYNVLWKTSAYVAAIFIVQLLEDAVRLSIHHQGLRPVLALLRAPHFWVVQIWMAMVLLVFCTFRKVIRSITPEQARELFVGPHARASDESGRESREPSEVSHKGSDVLARIAGRPTFPRSQVGGCDTGTQIVGGDE